MDAAIVRNSLRVMVLMRLNCLIPFGALNYVFGITGVDWVAFLLAMVGILPWQFLLVFLGASAEHVYEDEGETMVIEVVLIATGIAFCVIGMVITWRFAKKELQKVRTRGHARSRRVFVRRVRKTDSSIPIPSFLFSPSPGGRGR